MNLVQIAALTIILLPIVVLAWLNYGRRDPEAVTFHVPAEASFAAFVTWILETVGGFVSSLALLCLGSFAVAVAVAVVFAPLGILVFLLVRFG